LGHSRTGPDGTVAFDAYLSAESRSSLQGIEASEEAPFEAMVEDARHGRQRVVITVVTPRTIRGRIE